MSLIATTCKQIKPPPNHTGRVQAYTRASAACKAYTRASKEMQAKSESLPLRRIHTMRSRSAFDPVNDASISRASDLPPARRTSLAAD